MSTLPVNPLDNSESVAVNEKKDVFLGSNTGTVGELNDAITYMKWLKDRAVIQSADGKSIHVGDQAVPIVDLLPPTTEFDEERMRVIRLLTKLGPDDAIYQGLAKDFGESSLFNLASEIANYSIARTRGEKIYGLLHGKETDGKTIYSGLIGADAAAKTKAKASLSTGAFTQSYKKGRAQ